MREANKVRINPMDIHLLPLWRTDSSSIIAYHLTKIDRLSEKSPECKYSGDFSSPILRFVYFLLSDTATATATVAPTMGLLPIPKKPIISTWAGTELEPANWASECIRPMVSVMP